MSVLDFEISQEMKRMFNRKGIVSNEEAGPLLLG